VFRECGVQALQVDQDSVSVYVYVMTHVYFVLDRLEQPRGRAKIFCTGTTSPMNQPRKGPFHLHALSPHQFQQSAGAIPLLSLWSGERIPIGKCGESSIPAQNLHCLTGRGRAMPWTETVYGNLLVIKNRSHLEQDN
jgi:hypothetical protein